jgi:hypothetical protein
MKRALIGESKRERKKQKKEDNGKEVTVEVKTEAGGKVRVKSHTRNLGKISVKSYERHPPIPGSKKPILTSDSSRPKEADQPIAQKEETQNPDSSSSLV